MKNHALILVRGLGGTGKTTLSTALARTLRIPVLNRDDVKDAIKEFNFDLKMQSEIGYKVMNNLASVQLRNGVSVILDANARFRSMQSFYQALTRETQSALYVINCVCSDELAWKKRIEARGNSHPISFEETKLMSMESFDLKNQIQIDTNAMSINESVEKVLNWLR